MASTEFRGEEEWARRVVAASTGLRVERHDDGSLPGMHDLDVFHGDTRVGAVEVTTAVDRERIELWKAVNGDERRCIVPGLVGGWMVSLRPGARAKKLREELPGLLAELEGAGISSVGWYAPPVERGIEDRLLRLGVVDLLQGRTDWPGSVYFTIDEDPEGSSGAVPDVADALVGWIEEFLSHGDRADVRDKLVRAGVAERHAFVVVPPLSTAPFTVWVVLMRAGAQVPRRDPVLPEGITHVWVVGAWSGGCGFRWSVAEGWWRFSNSGLPAA